MPQNSRPPNHTFTRIMRALFQEGPLEGTREAHEAHQAARNIPTKGPIKEALRLEVECVHPILDLLGATLEETEEELKKAKKAKKSTESLKAKLQEYFDQESQLCAVLVKYWGLEPEKTDVTACHDLVCRVMRLTRIADASGMVAAGGCAGILSGVAAHLLGFTGTGLALLKGGVATAAGGLGVRQGIRYRGELREALEHVTGKTKRVSEQRLNRAKNQEEDEEEEVEVAELASS